MAANLVLGEKGHSLAFGYLNRECDLMNKLIPGSRQISGSDTDDVKEEKIDWFLYGDCDCRGKSFALNLTACGNQNTPPDGKLSINPIQKKGKKGKVNPEIQSQTPNTCANTTSPSLRNSSGQKNSKLSATPPEEKDTPLTQITEASCKSNQETSALSRNGQAGSKGNLESTEINTTKCLPTKEGNAPSAETPKETHQGESSISTIVTSRAQLGDSYAHLAIWDSESSKMNHDSYDGPRCICGKPSGKRVLISKPTILGMGLNLQHCNHLTYFPSHSFEQWYQSIRRCWRFGQKHPVTVDVITSEGEANILSNLQRKATAADSMFSNLVAMMNNELSIQKKQHVTTPTQLPNWI